MISKMLNFGNVSLSHRQILIFEYLHFTQTLKTKRCRAVSGKDFIQNNLPQNVIKVKKVY